MELDLEMLTRSADTRPASWNPEERTIEAVLSTGAAVQRRDARGPFLETLNLDSVDLPRLAGLPVLDGHRQDAAERVVGVILSARREPGGIVATIKLSEASDVASTVTKVREGVLRSVSIGYAVQKVREFTDSAGRRVKEASISIHEASFVAVPADPGAKIRSNTMPTQTVEPTEETRAAEQRAQTRTQIRQIARAAGLDSAWADAQIDADADVTAARAAAFEAMQTRTANTGNIRISGQSSEDPFVVRSRMAEALAARMGGPAPSDAARQYVGLGLHDMARAALAASGQSVAMLSGEELIQRAMHGVSDFPMLLNESGNRILRPSFEAAASPIKRIARQTTAPDFRAITSLQFGEFGRLEEVSEQGEITATTTAEAKEAYVLRTFGRTFNVSRRALINDDLGAFGRWAAEMGRAAAETETAEIVGLLTQASGAGPVMQDGKRLFSAEHGNLSTTAELDGGPAILSEARKAMRKQKGLDGKSPINAVAKYLLVGPDQETNAERLLLEINPTRIEDANPLAGTLTLLVEPRITDSDFRFFSDPAALPTIEYAYLSSAQGPQLSSRDGWEVLGREFRCVLDFGCGAVDWRGCYRVPGAPS